VPKIAAKSSVFAPFLPALRPQASADIIRHCGQARRAQAVGRRRNRKRTGERAGACVRARAKRGDRARLGGSAGACGRL
jgi:hypothetical protein